MLKYNKALTFSLFTQVSEKRIECDWTVLSPLYQHKAVYCISCISTIPYLHSQTAVMSTISLVRLLHSICLSVAEISEQWKSNSNPSISLQPCFQKKDGASCKTFADKLCLQTTVPFHNNYRLAVVTEPVTCGMFQSHDFGACHSFHSLSFLPLSSHVWNILQQSNSQ